MSVLTLRLEGVMQAWGSESDWNYRATDLYPTKSGVIGLISCAMGLTRDNPEIADLNKSLSMGVRVDRAGIRLVDFQTVTGFPLMNAEGKKRVGSSVIICEHEYLHDASFLVALEGDTELLTRISMAVSNPKWPYGLGRKSCVPSRPVIDALPGVYGSIDDALHRAPLCDRPDQGPKYACEVEGQIADGHQMSRSDVRSDVPKRRFQMRHVTRLEVTHVSDQT